MDRHELHRYEEARKRVKKIKGFYIHFIVYVLVNFLLISINLFTLSSESGIWFIYPLLGWGIGIVSHGISVFGLGRLFGASWEEKKIQEILNKDRK
jgi:hypothetical protein